MLLRYCRILPGLLALGKIANGEVFSSYAHMEQLRAVELELVEALERFAQIEDDRIETARKHLKTLSKVEINTNDLNPYETDPNLVHPVSQYKLIKRFAHEWDDILRTYQDGTYINGLFFKNKLTKAQEKITWPSNKDLTGAAKAFMRLQDTYEVSAENMASGNLGAGLPEKALTANECFDIGHVAYTENNYYHTIHWMHEAKRRLSKYYDENNKEHNHLAYMIYDHLTFSYNNFGLMRKAYDYAIQTLEHITSDDPQYQRILGNYQYYKKQIQGISRLRGESKKLVEIEYYGNPHDMVDPPAARDELKKYEETCRKTSIHDTLKKEMLPKLKCYYWTQMGNPKLLIQPFKIELISVRPTFTLFHDFVRDDEADILDEIIRPKLNRATIQDPRTGEFVNADYRVQKSGWLKEEDHDVVGKVNRRIAVATGMDMEKAELLQMGSYGMGGQYEPHFDHARDTDVGQFDPEEGNRVATALLYLNQPKSGGNTIYLDQGYSVQPVRGSMVFWFNLHPNETGDTETRHAACPVLVGNKLVSNKWIHVRGQEFTRPCNLDRNARSTLMIPGWNRNYDFDLDAVEF